MKKLRRIIIAISLIVAGAALWEQLKMPHEKRTWHGKVSGIIPYDFRAPTWQRIVKSWWNPEDPRIFTERCFGIGWAINLYSLRERFRSWMGKLIEQPEE